MSQGLPFNSPVDEADAARFDDLAAVVLVGGKSSRMGLPKADLLIGEETFLERIVSQLEQVTSSVIVVGNVDTKKHRLPIDTEYYQDQRSDSGPAEGIRVGLAALSESFPKAFVTCCDSPLLRPDLIRMLYHLDTGTGIAPCQTASPQRQRIYGMTAIYPTSVHPTIDQCISRGNLRVTDIVLDCGLKLIDIEQLRDADPELVSFENINTMADYQNLKRRLGT